MKICLILPDGFPVPAIQGGAVETLVENLVIENEKHSDFDINVISIFNELAVKESKKYKNTNFIYIKFNKGFNHLIDFIYKVIKKIFGIITLKNIYYLKVYFHLKKNNYDLIVIEGGDLLAYKYIIKYLGKEKFIAHLHGEVFNRKIADLYGNYIAVSDYIANKTTKDLKINRKIIHTLYNCASPIFFSDDGYKKEDFEAQTLKANLGFDANDFIILFCGRIVPEKGLKELIMAVNNIKDIRVKLLIIGSVNFAKKNGSPYYDEIIDLIKGSKGKIKTTGYIHNDKLPKYYAISDVLVMPTLIEEAAGLVAIEGMASGLPLIVTKSGGLVEYVNEDSAVVLEKDNELIPNISETIINFKNNKQMLKNMKKKSLEKSKLYTPTSYYNNFKEIIQKINMSNKNGDDYE